MTKHLSKFTVDCITGSITLEETHYKKRLDPHGQEITVTQQWRGIIPHGDIDGLNSHFDSGLTDLAISAIQEQWSKITPPEGDSEENTEGVNA